MMILFITFIATVNALDQEPLLKETKIGEAFRGLIDGL